MGIKVTLDTSQQSTETISSNIYIKVNLDERGLWTIGLFKRSRRKYWHITFKQLLLLPVMSAPTNQTQVQSWYHDIL